MAKISKKELNALRDQLSFDIRKATENIGKAGRTVTLEEVRHLMNLHREDCPEWILPL